MAATRLSIFVLFLGFLLASPSRAFDTTSGSDVERLERAWTEATGLDSIDIRSIRPPNPFLEGFYDELPGNLSAVFLHSTIRATIASGGIGADVRCDLTSSEGALRIRHCRDRMGGAGISALISRSRAGTLDFNLPVEAPAASGRTDPRPTGAPLGAAPARPATSASPAGS